MNRPRRIIRIPGQLITSAAWLAIAAGVGVGCYFVFMVPSWEERAGVCPAKEETLDAWKTLEKVQPLKGYQRYQRDKTREYVLRWCQ